MEIIFKPNIEQYNEIINWLLDEKKRTGSSFYSNQNLIRQSFEEERMIVSQDKGEIIGFICWTEHTFGNMMYVDLDIMAIKPKYRSKGFGRKFYSLAEDYLKKKGVVAIKLFCSPENSEPFWQRMGFIKFPPTKYEEHPLTYYKTILSTDSTIDYDASNKIELWNVESYQASKIPPNWVWEINDNFKGIIQPCDSDWNLRLTLNDEIIKEDKVKYFTAKKDELMIGSFLYFTPEKLKLFKKDF